MLADTQKMTNYICNRLPPEGLSVCLADGPEGGPIWADLLPTWDDKYGWELLIESNEPEWVSLQEVYAHFRRKDMTTLEWHQAIFWELHGPRHRGSALDPKLLCPTIFRHKPFWDRDLGQLWCGDWLIKQYREEAQNQRVVLAAFQEQEWRHRIDDPIPGRRFEARWQPKRRLRDTITGLNAVHVTPGVIRFKGDGTGTGIIWDWCR